MIFNLAKLRAESDPEAFAGERARVEARIASLERKLAAATPFASLDRAALVERSAALQRESDGASQRLGALGGAGDASTGTTLWSHLLGGNAGADTGAGVVIGSQCRVDVPGFQVADAIGRAAWCGRMKRDFDQAT